MNCVFPYEHISQPNKESTKSSFGRRKKILSMDFLKIGALGSFCIGLFLTYIITITISSTQGYYYDQQRKQQERVNFNYNVTTLEILDLQSNLWNVINFNPRINNTSIQYLEVRE